MKRWLFVVCLMLATLCPAAGFGAGPVLIGHKWDDLTEPANGETQATAMTPDGRYILLHSEATDLVPIDTNGQRDVFIYDRNTGTVEMIALPTTDGAPPNGGSFAGGISADGRYVALSSRAENLVGGGMPGTSHPYVYDRQTGSLELVSVADDGTPGNAGSSPPPLLSADGRYVCFESPASNLVPGDTNDKWDVFVRDRETGHTERVSVDTDGSQLVEMSVAAEISPDGRYVTFCCPTTDLSPPDAASHMFIHDRTTDTVEVINLDASGTVPTGAGPSRILMSGDARFLAFRGTHDTYTENDTNGVPDVFLRDRVAGSTELVSYDTNGQQFSGSTTAPDMSGDARFVLLYQLRGPGDGDSWGEFTFLRDRGAGVTVVPGVGGIPGPISANGRFVALSRHHRPDVEYHSLYLWEPELVEFGTIAGTVTASDTGEPVGGAHVWIGGTLLTVTGADGSYSMEVAVTGDTSVRAEMEGYAAAVETGVAVTAGGVTEIDLVLHLQPFPDVVEDSWAASSIAECVNAGIVGGYEDGLYHGDSPVDRGQMAAYVSRGLAGGEENVPDPTVAAGSAVISSASAMAADTDPGFTDVDESHWAYKYICYAVDQNVVQGYPEGDYRPEVEVTRDQMAVYMARAMVAPTTSALADYVPADPRDFPDVPSNSWAYLYVEYCAEHGVVGGYEDGYYHPEYVVTRDQMAVYVARAFGL